MLVAVVARLPKDAVAPAEDEGRLGLLCVLVRRGDIHAPIQRDLRLLDTVRRVGRPSPSGQFTVSRDTSGVWTMDPERIQ